MMRVAGLYTRTQVFQLWLCIFVKNIEMSILTVFFSRCINFECGDRRYRFIGDGPWLKWFYLILLILIRSWSSGDDDDDGTYCGLDSGHQMTYFVPFSDHFTDKIFKFSRNKRSLLPHSFPFHWPCICMVFDWHCLQIYFSFRSFHLFCLSHWKTIKLFMFVNIKTQNEEIEEEEHEQE